ncbi:MAG: TIGR00730 family Rossman fold protein [Prevotellaceae bacterium]|jgi:uncharacterized protein (TIGR00730 family)|nr:TIGR00730 family Rossman fold protein [Prevotellaceae bacterium]
MGKRICVYCASSNRIASHYFEAAEAFARLAVVGGYSLVCGGSWRGLMGALVEATLACGGEIEGVIPKFMCSAEWQDKRIRNLTVVESMQERKTLLMKDVAAVVALPGGPGTLEELSEVISLKRLGFFSPPIIIYNHQGFYNKLIDFFEWLRRENMLSPNQPNAWVVAHTVDEIIPAIEAAPMWRSDLNSHL